MLSIDASLDCTLLTKIVSSGHSRIPVYEEVMLPCIGSEKDVRTQEKVKKIIGILLVKQCVLLDPKGNACTGLAPILLTNS